MGDPLAVAGLGGLAGGAAVDVAEVRARSTSPTRGGVRRCRPPGRRRPRWWCKSTWGTRGCSWCRPGSGWRRPPSAEIRPMRRMTSCTFLRSIRRVWNVAAASVIWMARALSLVVAFLGFDSVEDVAAGVGADLGDKVVVVLVDHLGEQHVVGGLAGLGVGRGGARAGAHRGAEARGRRGAAGDGDHQGAVASGRVVGVLVAGGRSAPGPESGPRAGRSCARRAARPASALAVSRSTEKWPPLSWSRVAPPHHLFAPGRTPVWWTGRGRRNQRRRRRRAPSAGRRRGLVNRRRRAAGRRSSGSRPVTIASPRLVGPTTRNPRCATPR